jgi:hypothetical protein
MLLNESHDGFGVLVAGLPSVPTNQKIQFHTNRGWFECRIVHAEEVVPTKAIGEPSAEEQQSAEDDELAKISAADIRAFTADSEGPWYRLGIRCLRQIAPPAEPAASPPLAGRILNPAQWLKSITAAASGPTDMK